MAHNNGFAPPLAQYPLAQVELAIAHLISGTARGKITLAIDAKETQR